ncbi:class III poly(R)-hydroxyalkanoic acid synthase subunit PhaE [Luteimonas sp. A611]
MLNQGSGIGAGSGQAQDFERLARQYWAAWGDALRGTTPGGGQAGTHTWQDAIESWTRHAHGGRSGVNDALERFNSQARDWYGHMQQVAAQFAGRDHTAGDITQAWKQALGAAGTNPFPEMLRSMRGQGLGGLDQWVEDASPWLDAMRGEGMSWLRMPAFGLGREHQERLQQLAQSLLEYEESKNAYNALMLKATQQAFTIFEDKLAAHEEPGRQIETPRALFDLWIDAAEEAYAEIALSQEFRQAYGQMVDAQMRLRAGMQRQVEQMCSTLGMPTRTEVDAAHRKIVELERALRRLRDAVEGGPMPATPAASGQRGARPPGKRAAAKAAAGKSKSARVTAKADSAGAASKTASSKAVPSKSASSRSAGKTASRKAASGKTASKSASSKSTSNKPTSRKAAPRKLVQAAKPAKPAARSKPAKRAARKLAPRPSVTARRPPTNRFTSHIPIPDTPLPPDAAPVSKRGGR